MEAVASQRTDLESTLHHQVCVRHFLKCMYEMSRPERMCDRMLKCLHKIGWTLGIGVEGSPVAVLPPRGAKQVGSRPGLLPSVFLSEAFVAV